MIDKQWKIFVKDQLSLHGGRLFQWIAKLDKQYLNVSCDTHSSSGDPDLFMAEQISKWSNLWNPDDESYLEFKVACEYLELWKEARTQSGSEIFDSSLLDLALKGYNKETKGSDNYKPSEIHGFPLILKDY